MGSDLLLEDRAVRIAAVIALMILAMLAASSSHGDMPGTDILVSMAPSTAS